MLGVAVVVVNVVPIILLLKTATPIAIAVTLALAVVLFGMSYLLTAAHRWWVLPLLGSPVLVLPLLTGILFILAVFGIVPVP